MKYCSVLLPVLWANILFVCLVACEKTSGTETTRPTPEPGSTGVVIPPPIVVPPPAPGQNPDSLPETYPTIQTAVNDSINTSMLGYYESLPAYYQYTSKKYPVIVTLHGVDDMGNGRSDLIKVLNRSIPRLINDRKFPPSFTVNGQDFSFIVISPQIKKKPSPKEIDALVNYVVKKYRVDG